MSVDIPPQTRRRTLPARHRARRRSAEKFFACRSMEGRNPAGLKIVGASARQIVNSEKAGEVMTVKRCSGCYRGRQRRQREGWWGRDGDHWIPPPGFTEPDVCVSLPPFLSQCLAVLGALAVCVVRAVCAVRAVRGAKSAPQLRVRQAGETPTLPWLRGQRGSAFTLESRSNARFFRCLPCFPCGSWC